MKEGKFARWRGPGGKWVKGKDAGDMTAKERTAAGIKRVMFSKTRAGGLGKRARPLIGRLREFEEEGLDWQDVPDNYFHDAVRLGIV